MILPPTVTSPDFLVKTTQVCWVTRFRVLKPLQIPQSQLQPILHLCISIHNNYPLV